MFRLFRSAEKVNLKIGEIVPHVEETLRRDINIGKERMKTLQKSVRKDFTALEEHIDVLEKKKATGFSEAVKKRFCRTAKSAISSLSENGWRDFIRTADEALATVNKVNMKEFKHLHAFRDDMSRIVVKAKTVESGINHMKKAADTYKLKKISILKQRIEEFRELQGSLKQAKTELHQINQALSIMEREYKKLDKESETLEIHMEEKKEENREKEASIIRQKIASELSLGRVLKKYLHSSDPPHNEKVLVESYIKNPVSTFLEDGELKIQGILEKADKTEVQDKNEKKRIRNALQKLDFLASMRSHHEGLTYEIEEHKKMERERIALLATKKNKIDGSRDEHAHEISKLRERKVSTEEKIKELEEEERKGIKDMEKFVFSITGNEVSIVL